MTSTAAGSDEEMNKLLHDPDFEPIWSDRDTSPPPFEEIRIPASTAPLAETPAPSALKSMTMLGEHQGKENTPGKKRKRGNRHYY